MRIYPFHMSHLLMWIKLYVRYRTMCCREGITPSDERLSSCCLLGNEVSPISLALAALMSAAGAAHAQAPQVPLQQYKCYSCHADDEAKTGPAYVDVADKFRGNPQAVIPRRPAGRSNCRRCGKERYP
jgi:hypothetical protein